jgi:hypothetical protein
MIGIFNYFVKGFFSLLGNIAELVEVNFSAAMWGCHPECRPERGGLSKGDTLLSPFGTIFCCAALRFAPQKITQDDSSSYWRFFLSPFGTIFCCAALRFAPQKITQDDSSSCWRFLEI